MTIKKVFAGKSVKVGSYKLKLSADGGSKTLSFKVTKAVSNPTDAARAPPMPAVRARLTGATRAG